jgi:hypothetical protein
MSRDRRRPLRFESLEGKQLLSAAAPALPLGGTLAASAYQVTGNNGTTETARIGLAGRAGSMGNVVGLLTEGIDESVEVVARANLVLANASGSVTLTLNREVIMQNLTMPYNMGFTADYTITSATGAYRHDVGGHGTIAVSPDVGDFDMHVTLDSGG